MRTDLVIRYLSTTIERLDRVRRHLQGEFQEEKVDLEKGNSLISNSLPLVTSMLETIQTEINLINSALKSLE